MIRIAQAMLKDQERMVISGRMQVTGRIRICVVGMRGFPHVQGGIETHCENLYPLLAGHGHEVIVFARQQYVGISKPYLYKGVRVIPLACFKNKFLEAFLHTLAGILRARKYRPDILHIHAIGPSFFALIARLSSFSFCSHAF